MTTATMNREEGVDFGELSLELRRLVDAGHADEAIRLTNHLAGTDLRDAPEVEIEIARAAARTGNFRRAMAAATTALWNFRSKRDLRGQMRANLVLGGIALEQGQPDAAEHQLGVARMIATAVDDRQVQAQVTGNLACLAIQKGDLALAEGLYRSALAYAQAQADLRGQAEVLHNLNLTYRGLGRYEEAEIAGRQALAFGEQLEDGSMVSLALSGLAETAAWITSSPADESLLDRAEAAARQAEDPVREANAYRARAIVRLKARRYDQAIERATAARALAAKHGADLMAVECLGIVALAHKRAGNAEAAGKLKEEVTVALYRLKARLEVEWFDREWAID
jgi:tetratricopeptide (TPR) repeat protein